MDWMFFGHGIAYGKPTGSEYLHPNDRAVFLYSKIDAKEPDIVVYTSRNYSTNEYLINIEQLGSVSILKVNASKLDDLAETLDADWKKCRLKKFTRFRALLPNKTVPLEFEFEKCQHQEEDEEQDSDSRLISTRDREPSSFESRSIKPSRSIEPSSSASEPDWKQMLEDWDETDGPHSQYAQELKHSNPDAYRRMYHDYRFQDGGWFGLDEKGRPAKGLHIENPLSERLFAQWYRTKTKKRPYRSTTRGAPRAIWVRAKSTSLIPLPKPSKHRHRNRRWDLLVVRESQIPTHGFRFIEQFPQPQSHVSLKRYSHRNRTMMTLYRNASKLERLKISNRDFE